SRLANEAKDEKVREAARDILDKLGRDPENFNTKAKQDKGKDKGDKKDEGEGMGAGQATEAKGGDAKGEPQGQAKANDPKDTEDKTAKAQQKTGRYGPGDGGDIFDDLAKMDPTKDFLKRGGVLQLQRLKDRLGPDGLKKAGLTDKDWDEFMKNAAAYEQLLRS